MLQNIKRLPLHSLETTATKTYCYEGCFINKLGFFAKTTELASSVKEKLKGCLKIQFETTSSRTKSYCEKSRLVQVVTLLTEVHKMRSKQQPVSSRLSSLSKGHSDHKIVWHQMHLLHRDLKTSLFLRQNRAYYSYRKT